MFRPNIADSSNSEVIDDSKSNRLSAIPVSLSIPTPSLAAYTAASAIFLPPSLPYRANASVLLAKSFITFDGITPESLAVSLTDLIISKATSDDPSFNLLNEPTKDAASPPAIPKFAAIMFVSNCNPKVASFIPPN